MTQKTIVVVEDNEEYRQNAEETLKDAGYNLAFASTMTEAMEAVRQPGVVGVLSDVYFPSEDGADLHPFGMTLEAICKEDGLPVVLVTSNKHGEDAMEWMIPVFAIKGIAYCEGLKDGQKKWLSGWEKLAKMIQG